MLMKLIAKLLPRSAMWLLAGALISDGRAASTSIGVNFAGPNSQNAPTFLEATNVAGVVAQAGWNNFSVYDLTNWTLLDSDGAFTGINITYSTQEMGRSTAYDPANNTTNGDSILLNGYLNSLGDRSVGGTNIITFTGLSPTEKYTVIAYTLRDQSGEQAAYWINEGYDTAYHILTEGGLDWVLSPQFRQATNADPFGFPDQGNYVRWDNVSPRAGGSLTVNVSSEFYRGPINGIQLIGTNGWPANTNRVAITFPPRNASVPPGQPGKFRVVINGPWNFQWYSNDVAIVGATSDSFTTVPLWDELGTRAQYKVLVSNGISQQASDPVHLILVPPLPPGGIFYDGFAYPAGPLGNWGEWTLANIAQVSAPGLSYTDGTNWLQVSGNAMVAPIDWDPFPNIPLKVFGTNSYGGPNSTNYMSFLFDFRNLNPTNNSGYVGVSAFEGNPPSDWGNERFFVGKTWYGDFITVDGWIPAGDTNIAGASVIPYQTNGFLVFRIIQDDAGGSQCDLFLNPPLAALPEIPTASAYASKQATFNAVGVNAGEWAGPKNNHGVPYTSPGPLVDEFRFGSTYASVAPIAPVLPPSLTIRLIAPNIRLSWPSSAGYTLQMSDSLGAPGPVWRTGPAGNPVDIPIGTTSQFFRLIK